MRTFGWMILMALGALPTVLNFSRGLTWKDSFRKSALQSIADASPPKCRFLFPGLYLAVIMTLLALLSN